MDELSIDPSFRAHTEDDLKIGHGTTESLTARAWTRSPVTKLLRQTTGLPQPGWKPLAISQVDDLAR